MLREEVHQMMIMYLYTMWTSPIVAGWRSEVSHWYNVTIGCFKNLVTSFWYKEVQYIVCRAAFLDARLCLDFRTKYYAMFALSSLDKASKRKVWHSIYLLLISFQELVILDLTNRKREQLILKSCLVVVKKH